MQKLIHWWDKYVLKFGILFLLIFIPLSPKIPFLPEVFDIIHSWQYIRLDDIAVLLISIAFLVETIRRRISLTSPLSMPIALYWTLGAVSAIHSLLFIVGTVPNMFSHLVVLYYLRRIEYMILFFIAFNGMKTKKDVHHYMIAFLIAYCAITVYGLGQKIMPSYTPAFPTMSEEFAKGEPVILDTDSRVMSTFGGHYDLAAYLVFTLAIMGSLVLGLKDMAKKAGLALLSIAGLLLLLFTKSRVSFSAFIVAVVVLLICHKKKWLIVPLVVLGSLSLVFGGGLTERFGKTVRVEPVVYELPEEKPLATLEDFSRTHAEVGVSVTPTPYEELPLGSGFLDAPFLERFGEPYEKEFIDYSEATSSATPLTPRTYLVKQTMVYDISLTTRIQGQWPRAIDALKRNFLFGSGFSALGAATDGNYFRMLGESGIAGTVSFLIIFVLFFLMVRRYVAREKNQMFRSFAIGVCAGISGLFINAIFIDIFEASKIAYVLWMTIGAVTALAVIETKDHTIPWKRLWSLVKSTPVAIGSLILFSILLFYSALGHHFSGDDYTWFRWAMTATLSDIPRYFVDSDAFFYRPLTKTAYYGLYTLFGDGQPVFYHLVNLSLHFASTLLVFSIVTIISKKRFVAYTAALLFLVHPIHAENIFWVSGLSSVMSGFFYLMSVLSMLQFDRMKKSYRWLWLAGSLLAFALALSSYEMSMTLPGVLLVYFAVNRSLYNPAVVVTKIHSFISRVIMPVLPHIIMLVVYLFIRNAVADSYWMQGDYNVNVAKLPFNLVGNSVGYLGELLFGFSAIPWYDALRTILREQIVLAVIGGGVVVVFAYGLYARLKDMKQSIPPEMIIYAGWFFVALIPSLGLGNIAERYLYIPSVGGVACIAYILHRIWRMHTAGKIISAVLLAGLLSYFSLQIVQAKETWRQAGAIAHIVIETIPDIHESFPENSTLFIVNVPLRVDRAWVFPVGLEDALWAIYYDDTLQVNTSLSIEKARAAADTTPNAYVFVYENGKLYEQ